MNWTDDYIGLPFKPDGRDRSGCDCWGLVCIVYKEQLGISLPEYRGIFKDQSISSLKAAARAYAIGKEAWQKVSKPEPFDVVMVRSGIYTWHVGIAIDQANMLHIMSGINSIIEPFTGIQWKNRVEEFRHYAR